MAGPRRNIDQVQYLLEPAAIYAHTIDGSQIFITQHNRDQINKLIDLPQSDFA